MTNEEQKQVIVPFTMTMAIAGLAGLLVYDALSKGGIDTETMASARNALIADLVHGLADLLGPVGSVLFATVVVATSLGWCLVRVQRVRRARTA